MTQNVGGENLLVPLGTQVMDLNGIVVLNDTACFIWELLARDRSVDELASAVAESYDVDSARASADVRAFMDEIAHIGLLERKP